MQTKYFTTREARKDKELMRAVNLYTLFEKFPDAEKNSKGRTKAQLSSFLYQTYTFETIEVAKKAKNAHYHKVKRVSQRVAYILANAPKSYFVTLTFTNEILASTTEETRRRYVRRYLKDKAKETNSHYIANIDYGSKNGREHYHAVTNFNCSDWKYGHSLSKEVKLYAPLSAKYDNLPEEEYKKKALKTTQQRLSKYTAKLGFHATKDSTRDASLIYSRIPTEKPVEVKEEPEKPMPYLEEITDPAFDFVDDLFSKQVAVEDLK